MWAKLKMLPRELFLTFDQFLNVLCFGYADETLSARLYRAHRAGRLLGRVLMPVVDFLWFWGDKPHCYRAYLKEKENRYLPPEYRA